MQINNKKQLVTHTAFSVLLSKRRLAKAMITIFLLSLSSCTLISDQEEQETGVRRDFLQSK